MAFTFGFFNSVNGDRVYNADQMSNIFEGLISDGVYESVGDKMAVQPNNAMVIQIATGRGWFNRRWVNNDTPYTMTLEASDVTLNRYVAVCIRVDKSNSVRAVEPVLKYSDFATNPDKPTMTRSELVNEYCLAYVYIPAKATSITAGNIEDTRQDKSLCGWVTGLVDQITPDTLYTQFTDQFNEWFGNIQDTIDENVETMLVNALPESVNVVLNASSWVNGLINVTVNNMNNTKSVLIQPDNSTIGEYVLSGVECVAQGVNTLTFNCKSTPTTDLAVNVIYMGV